MILFGRTSVLYYIISCEYYHATAVGTRWFPICCSRNHRLKEKIRCPSFTPQRIQIMHAEMKLNGGLIMIGDHCGADVGKQEALVTITLGVAAGEAMPLSNAFEANGGEIVDKPLKQFWGQGEQRRNFCAVQGAENGSLCLLYCILIKRFVA